MTLHVFGRLDPGTHPLGPALRSCLDSGSSVDSRAIACGLIHDHRVSREREDVFTSMDPNPVDCTGIFESLKDYYLTRVLKPPVGARDPDYLDPSLNRSNLVPVGATAESLRPSTELATIVSLNRQGEALRWARDQCRPGDAHYQWYEGLPAPDEITQIGTWLDGKLKVAEFEKRSAIAEILQARNGFNRATKRQGPTWATLAPYVLDEPVDKPDRWRDAVGAGHIGAAEWLAVLTYTAADATILVRPTILDAGGKPWHCVSPEGVPLREGGFVMELDPGHVGSEPRSEYLHPPIHYHIAQWDDAGGRCKKTTTPTPPAPIDPEPPRQRHHTLLQACYPGDAYFGRCACECGLC